jgi:hypothetical protein
MWARGTPDPKDDSSKFSSGGSMAALINGEISSCDSVPKLDTVFIIIIIMLQGPLQTQ